MLRRFHQFWLRLLTPVAKFLLRVGIGPDVVTLIGTLGVVGGAVGFFPRGELFWGTVVVTAFVFSDMLDGLMARMLNRSSNWGAFLDSTLDRLGDAAIFGGFALWYLTGGDNYFLGAVALYVLVMGSLTSYAKARAESLSMTANVGIAERADRLVTSLIAAGLTGLAIEFGIPYGDLLLPIVLCALAIASTVTVVQRIFTVRRQAFEGERTERPERPEQPEPSEQTEQENR
jgi:CDP-diacylglycerol--glycerol-3-phosphate 3-phosphatidyltransferase